MYAIDRIEDNFIIAEDLKTKQQINLKKEDFPFEIHEGMMFSIKGGKIEKETKEELNRRKMLREKMERLKKGNRK